MNCSELLIAPDLLIRPMSVADADLLLALYQQCEDFLALGPTPKASLEMVLADLQHSAADNGWYSGIWRNSRLCGVIDWIPCGPEAGTVFINLLMLAPDHRGQRIGRSVLEWLESHVSKDCGTSAIETAVQTNNQAAIRFWLQQGYGPVRGPVCNDDGTIVLILRKQLSM